LQLNYHLNYICIDILLQFLDVITFQGILIITNLGSFDPNLLIINSIPWLQLALSLESAVSLTIVHGGGQSFVAGNYRT
jgi:hypothetical protein